MPFVTTSTDNNTISTKLSTFKKLKFYKIPPPEQTPDITYIPIENEDFITQQMKSPTPSPLPSSSELNKLSLGAPPVKIKHKKLVEGYKEVPLIRYKFKPEDWKLKKSNFLFNGSIELTELQSLDVLDDSEVDLKDGMRCKLTIYQDLSKKNDQRKKKKIFSAGLTVEDVDDNRVEFGHVWFRKIYQDGLPVKCWKQSDQFSTIQRIIPQHYVIILSVEVGDEVKQVALGMVLNDFFDDLRLNSNLRDFEERFNKLKSFKESFSDNNDLISNLNHKYKSDYDIAKEGEEEVDEDDGLLSPTDSEVNSCNEKFDIEDDEDEDDFGDFVSGVE